MAKTLVFDGTETTASNELFLKLKKLSSDGDCTGIHYISFAPNSDIDAVVAAAMESLSVEGYSPIAPEDIQRVKTIAQAAWA